MLKFNDSSDWLDIRINDVSNNYFIPDNIENDICVDVGGNVGAFGIVYNNKFKKIIAFEPSTYSYNKYLNNISKNKINNINVYQYAVFNKSDKILHLKPWKFKNESGNASVIDSEQWNNKIYEEVKTISLDDIFERFNLSKINFLKIDCEGSEYSFLMNKDLSKIDYISMEIHHQLKEKVNELLIYLLERFNILEIHQSGKQKHIICTLKNKLI